MVRIRMKSGIYVLCLLLLVISSCTGTSTTGSSVTGPSTTGASIVQVESKYVCMVNENVYEEEQILVEVDGLNYYGCCMGCKAKLEKDESYRFATDPISGNQVNKALAIIGDCNRKAYYFETLENLQQYEC